MIGIGIGIPFYRASGGGAPSNTPRTQAFLTATGITDATIISALNAMDTSLISAGLLPSGTGAGKIKALYPFVGATAGTHKFNFVNPADTDAAFRLVFFGGWTHSANGALPNGTNAYADTFINGDSSGFYNNCSLSFYSRTNTTGNFSDIGSYANAANAFKSYGLQCRNTTGTRSALHDGNLASDWATFSFVNSFGFFVGSRISGTDNKIYRNGVLGATNTTNVNNAANNNTGNIYLGAANQAGTGAIQFSDRQSAFAHIGTGLIGSEVTALSSLVATFQTTLGRNV